MSRYIDADAFDDTVQRLNEQGWHITRIDYKRMDRVLFEMPTADVVERKRGEWMYLYEDNYKCSICGSWWCCTDSQIDEMNYCPHCGSRMSDRND